MMRRNATALMVMSPVLACLSQEGCELQFGQTKASITETPRGGFSEFFLCPLYTVCLSCNRTGSTFSALFKPVIFFIFHSTVMETWLVIPHIISTIAEPLTSLSQCVHDVTVKKSCLAALFFFFFTCGFLKSLDAFTDGNKDKLGLCVFLVVSLSCHLATPDNLHQRMLPFRRTCFFFVASLCSVTFCVNGKCCTGCVYISMYAHVCTQGHITPL